MKMSFTGSQGQAEPRPPTIAFVRGECHLMVHGAGIRGRLRTTVTELGARHDFFFQNQDPEVQKKKKRKKERKRQSKTKQASKKKQSHSPQIVNLNSIPVSISKSLYSSSAPQCD